MKFASLVTLDVAIVKLEKKKNSRHVCLKLAYMTKLMYVRIHIKVDAITLKDCSSPMWLSSYTSSY